MVRIKLSLKQAEALRYLKDQETTELFYGGGAGGGKSFLGCIWLISSCIAYPGTRYLMGRAVLKALKESTLLSFFRACKEVFNLTALEDYKYNMMEGRITFKNGSEIFLKDLYLYPSDPEFDSLGSTEYTGAFIDEVSEITEKAKNIVMSRLRYKLDEYGILPKLLMASNPAKNFAYREYWKPWRDGTLQDYRKFVPALVGDNPYISDYYAKNLMKLDENSKQRLLYGNWDYDDDPTKLFEYEKLLQMFANMYEARSKHQKYLTVDVARYGSDRTVIIQWIGMHISNIKAYDKTNLKDLRELLESIAYHERIPRGNIIIDEDGVGGGLVDEMKGVKGFINNARALESKKEQNPGGAYTHAPKHNFANLKTQAYFALAKAVDEGVISIYQEVKMETKELIIQDLQQIKLKDADKDVKLSVTPKDEVKENLGRSPDFGDAMMMRMWFELKPVYKPYIAV